MERRRYKEGHKRGLRERQLDEEDDNVDHLMLSPDVLQAVEKGQFAIYAVRSIEEALTLLTGLPVGRRRKDDTFTPGSLYDMVDRRLERLGDYAQNSFRRTRKG